MQKYMLDSNICIYTIKNRPPSVRQEFVQHQDMMCISTITKMELIVRVEKSAVPERNLNIVESFIARLEVLDYGQRAAEHTGQLRAELDRKGTPIDPYDQMIAGHARSQGLVLVTNNTREFERVPGLRIENWAD